MRAVQLLLKRLMDVAGALFLLSLLWPLMLVIALLIPIKLGPGGVFFRQRRPGFRERPIDILKFRTMLEAFDREGRILPEKDRLPPFGWKLRKWSLDELPQLWLVFKGEMSLVGPRPLLTEYLEAYPAEFRRRHDVKPGISGWAQVKGRHIFTFSQRLALDVWYVDHWSIWLDVKIAFLTITNVVGTRGVKRPDQPVGEFDDLGLHAHVKVRRRDEVS
jgi:sugar transferase EpsL